MVGTNKIFIVQHPLELKTFEGQKGFGQSSNMFIAWTPAAVDGLRQMGVDYLSVGDLHPEQINFEENDMFVDGMRRWCNAIDEILVNNIPELGNLGILPFTQHWVHKRMWFLTYATEIVSLCLIKEKIQPENIYFADYLSGYCSPFLRVIRYLATLPDWKRQICSVQAGNWQLTEPNEASFYPDFERFDVTRTTWKSVFMRTCIDRGKWLINNTPTNRSIKTLLQSNNLLKINEDSLNLLVFMSTEEESEPLLSELLSAIPKLNIFYWDEIVDRSRNNLVFDRRRILSQIESANELKHLQIRNIPLILFIHDFISKFVEIEIDRLYQNVVLFRSLHEKARFQGVITSHGFAISETIFTHCERHAIPGITCLHGGTIGVFTDYPTQNFFLGHRGSFRYELVYGKSIAKVQNKVMRKWNSQAEFVPVGSTYFKRLLSRVKTTGLRGEVNGDHKLRVCIVVARFSNFIDGNKSGTSSSANMYKLLYETVDKLQASELLYVTVKNGYFVERYDLDLFREFPKVKFLSTEEKIIDHFGYYDLFILHSLSTTFFELVCSEKPILLFNDPRTSVLEEEAEELINARAHLVQNLDEYRKEIEEVSILGRGSEVIQDKKYEDCRFYEEYCGGAEGNAAVNGSKWIQKKIFGLN